MIVAALAHRRSRGELLPDFDVSARRLFVDGDLSAGVEIELDRAQANYLLSVLRLGVGSGLLVFNGRDGEWRALVEPTGRKAARLRAVERVREQTRAGDLLYLFAPLKHARLDYLVQKAVEMGVSALRPVMTRRTVASRVNLERARSNAIEAAEQCGILALPAILPDLDLAAALQTLEPERLLVFCDEEAPIEDPVRALSGAAGTRLALLVGPEGGFDPAERALVAARGNLLRVSLGPRILRADTAAVAALALVQSTLGDWR